MKTFTYVILFTFFLFTSAISGQTCNGNTFSSPGTPTTCTYSYISPGIWVNQFGIPIAAPSSVDASESACILVDNATNFSQVKGTLYVAPGVTYSGNIPTLSNATIIAEGTINFGVNPSIGSGTDLFIDVNGIINIPGNYSSGGDGSVNNAGEFNISGDFNLGGNTVVNNFNNGSITVQNDVSISNTFNNCGLLEVLTGELTAGGGSSLNNLCTTYIRQDMTLSSDYINDGLLVVDGVLDFNGSNFINNDILLATNLVLNNDALVGNNETSLLIVRNNAELQSGSSITGHYYYDIDDGGGFDTVCGTCTEDIDIVYNLTLPSIPADLVADCGDNIIIVPPTPSASIDFDGINDYAQQINTTINGLNDYTISFWFKYDGPIIADNSQVFVMGQRGLFEVYISEWSTSYPEYQTIGAYIYKSNGLKQGSGWRFHPESWTHFTVTVSHSGGNTRFRIFRNGYGSFGSTVNSTINSNSNPFRLGIINGFSSYDKFTGAIDEVKIFDTILTDDQIKGMIYQEIEQNGSNVRGKIIPKDIEDLTTKATVPWSDLQAYYPMTNIVSDSRTDDYSKNSNPLKLFNITTFQPQEAPMPYQTVADGDWSEEATWLHGDVWDIEDLETKVAPSQIPDPWSIVQIHHNVTTSDSHSSLGLYIDPNKKLTVNGDNSISNNWYLQLDGTLDLEGDSQLVQSMSSDLVTSATGQILRRQEGNADFYWYNYWSSPVGSLGATALSDNNGSSNNTNNSPFNINMLMDGTGITAMEFTSEFDAENKISDRWLYSFQNGLTYYDWVTLAIDDDILPGVGYTQKGTGNDSNPDPFITEQQYTFVGKPNNGTILIEADDVDGDDTGVGESVQDPDTDTYTLTTTLIGNPYPSALDAEEFIRDNIDLDNGSLNPIIEGTILLWEQWAGDSHWLAEYEGGYGYINLTETARAYQHPDIVIADPNNPDNRGIKTPTKFLPVGQAFFVEVVNDGDIEFNNGQRVFKQESLNESVFFRGTTSQEDVTNDDMTGRDGEPTDPEGSSTESRVDEMSILRLEFGVSSGASRSFVLGFSDYTTDGFDYGYDGGLITNPPADDMGSILNGQQYVIQAFAPITPEKEVALVMHSSGAFTHTLKSTEITNIPEGQDLFIRDNLTGASYDLRSTEPYNFTSEAGTFMDRFEVIFTDPTLSVNDNVLDTVVIFVDNNQDKLMVKGLDQDVRHMTITNMLGQTVKVFNDIDNNSLENGVHIGDLSSGVYLVNLMTEDNLKLNKKIILN